MCTRGKPYKYIEFFKTREVTESLKATSGRFPLV